MRGLLLLVLTIFSLPAFAQRASDIARGSSEADVLRLYGWPKGKSVADGRESWLYDQFQVTLEGGKVIGVAYVSAGKASAVNVRLAPSNMIAVPTPREAGRATPTAAGNFGGGATNVRTTSASTSHASPVPVTPAPSRTAPAIQLSQMGTETRPPAVTPANSSALSDRPNPKNDLINPFGVSVWWVLVGGIMVVMVIKIVLTIMQAQERQFRDDLLHQQQAAGKSPPTQTWKDDIAERLRTASTIRVEPPLTSNKADNPATDGVRVGGDRSASGTGTGRGGLTVDLLRRLEWKRFELIVQRYYAATGVRAELTCAGADGGVDVKLYRAGEDRAYGYVQCKAWGERKVKLTEMREFFGVMAADKIVEGIFVTTSDFWPHAREFAAANGIAALTSEEFVQLFNRLPGADRRSILLEATAGDFTTPSCPKCEKKMVWRESAAFWGCVRYPKCKSKPIYPRGMEADAAGAG